MTTSSHRIRRLVLCLPLALGLGACATASQRPASAPAYDRTSSEPVRMTPTTGAPLALDRGPSGGDGVGVRAISPASDVRQLETRKAARVHTATVVVLALVLAVGWVLAFGFHSECGCVQ